MKKYLNIIILFIAVSSIIAAEMKQYVSNDPRFKFSILYPASKWVFTHDVKIQSNSRFKDIIVLKTSNRVNQVRIMAYRGINAPDAKSVSRIIEAEFMQQEIRPGETFMKVRDITMSNRLITQSNSHSGWTLTLTYNDRREGNLYNTYWVFFRKVEVPSDIQGEAPTIIGRVYVIRLLVKQTEFRKIIGDVLKIVNSFKFITS